jgi:hypothetical protein
MQFSNHSFLEQLREWGFFTPSSLSNYNYTHFSMASMFQMEYLKGLEGSNTSHKDLTACYNIIRENRVNQILAKHGYEFHNYSVFDILDQPSIIKESALPERTRFITAQTLFNRLYTNLMFNMFDKLSPAQKKKRLYLAFNSNKRAIDSTRSIINTRRERPKFVYTHLIMPHFPYYFDSTGKERKLEELGLGMELNIKKYIEYVHYTNRLLLDLTEKIRAHSSKPPVIILVSDHGFREYPDPVDPKYHFINQMSVHLPGGDSASFYNGISNVNLFRMIFNKVLNQKFPLLKDSTSEIRP